MIGRNPASLPQPLCSAHGLDEVSRLTGNPFQARCTAGAGGLQQMDSGIREGTSVNNEEDVLPIMPQSAVYVRKDFVSLISIAVCGISTDSLRKVHDFRNCLIDLHVTVTLAIDGV